MDALALADRNPAAEVVFFAVGFETTAPANATAVYEAKRRGVHNISLLVSHVLVPPAMEAILSSPRSRVDGFLAAGHVCTLMGMDEYRPLAERFGGTDADLIAGLRCVSPAVVAGPTAGKPDDPADREARLPRKTALP
jgi:hydrogenase expression/formation protein HypD